MTPAIDIAKQAQVPFNIHKYDHDPAATSYGKEAAIHLQIDPRRVFKTLIVALEGKNVGVAVLPVSTQLNLKVFAKAVGVKKAAMADKKVAERATGYVLGGVSPLGQKKKLSTVIDASAQHFETIFVSAGRRGLEIELSPNDLCSLTDAQFETIGT